MKIKCPYCQILFLQKENDDEDDFLAMTGGVSPGSGTSAQQGLADDISVDEWWGTTFLRLSLRVWFWISIGLFVTFILTVITIEVLKKI